MKYSLDKIRDANFVKRIRKSMIYSRARQYFPMANPKFVDDRDRLEEAEIIRIDWPATAKKPYFGIVQDYDSYPKWTKFCRFLENNSFEYELYHIHRHDWIEKARKLDVIIGIPSSSMFHLHEIRQKYYIINTFLGKYCYPCVSHTYLYEDKCLEAYISDITGIPFAKTYVSHEKEDANELLNHLNYPFVSKIIPSSGSYGVELIRTRKKGMKLVKDAFSRNGRKINVAYFRQKNYVYFQEYIPNDGYDIRVIVVGNWVFGYGRKVLPGDFRASGMDTEVKIELPEEAMRIALNVNKIIKSPVLAVDMLHGLDGMYYIIEISPLYQMDSPRELQVNNVPGVYIFEPNGSYHFERGIYWVAELALREFLLKEYLAKSK